jgi:phenol 2-monooxygenase
VQFYRAGYRPGDPDIQPAASQALARPAQLTGEVDVLIVGSGPAGCVLAAQLAAFPAIHTRVVERRDGPLEVGQADGVACRTVEMFNAFGLAEGLLREAYWVNEVHFWGPSAEDRNRIERTGWVQDTPDGLSEFPHVIVNQARMQQFLLEYMERSPSRLRPDYGIEFVTLEIGEGEHPVAVTLRRVETGEELRVNARYVVGCDGARSAVRRAIGREMHGDAANHAWGVIDVLATTDFPDWRFKNVVQSAGKGSLLMIPREGGTMVRCYVDLGEVAPGDRSIRDTTAEQIAAVANAILEPYAIDLKSVAWSSVYEVGQRLAAAFDDVPAEETATRLPHVFIAGDACHTHSAKAGQGMNVSMQDGFNLGWKLAAVLEGRCAPELLHTYSAERQAVAQELIDFDRFFAAFMAQPIIDPERPELGGVSPQAMAEQFERQSRFTAGLATAYRPSVLTAHATHQALAGGFEIGTRFHSAPAIRVADGKRVELGHVHRADGRWRVYAFADRYGTGLLELARWLSDSEQSPVRRHTPEGADLDAVVDVRGVFQGDHHALPDVTSLPAVLFPRTGPLGLQDWEKAWAADPADDIFDLRAISREGAMVVVRPDQYVAHVLPLDAREELATFFAGILLAPAAAAATR